MERRVPENPDLATTSRYMKRLRSNENAELEEYPAVPLPVTGLAVKFLSDDREEAKAWAREHANKGWNIQGGPNDSMYTLVFNHKEGDTAPFPFTYIWDGEKIVKTYVEQPVEPDQTT